VDKPVDVPYSLQQERLLSFAPRDARHRAPEPAVLVWVLTARHKHLPKPSTSVATKLWQRAQNHIRNLRSDKRRISRKAMKDASRAAAIRPNQMLPNYF